MRDGFVVGDGAAGPLPGAWLVRNGAAHTAVGTVSGISEAVGLTFEEVGEGSFGESLGGGIGELFHSVEIDVASGSVVAEGLSGDNFPPVGGEFADLLEKFRGKLSCRHNLYHLVLATRTRM